MVTTNQATVTTDQINTSIMHQKKVAITAEATTTTNIATNTMMTVTKATAKKYLTCTCVGSNINRIRIELFIK